MADSDTDSTTTIESNEESPDVEIARILDHKFHLPKDLCENPEIFKQFFSLETWSQMSTEDQSRLNNFLPKFSEDNEQEQKETIKQLFANTLTRFGSTPLETFHNNLQDGNYRPDIAHYRKSILKAEEREQRIRECERISLLAEKLVSLREKLLRSAYKSPAGSLPELPTSSSPAPVPRLSSSSATMRATRRYFQEISKLADEFGLPLSEDEIMPEGLQTQLTKKQIKQFSEQGNLSPGAELRIVGTSSTREKTWDHMKNPSVSDERYKQMLQNYRKRKTIEPDQPEMEIDDIKLKDIFSRTQLTINPKKLITPVATTTKKSYGPYSRLPKVPLKNVRIPIKTESPSETDEEDWIKANVIKIEPKGQATAASTMAKPTKIKTIYPQQPGTIVVNRKRPSMDNVQGVRGGGKKIIIDAGRVINNKRIVVNPRSTIVMDPNDLIDESEADHAENSPEYRSDIQACFLSLIRDIFCSTRDHRMKLEELRTRISVWLKNPIASANDWFTHASDWSALVISAVHFLSGEFLDQPEDFVPYLEFKSQLNIYQWIGAGRDSDNRMKSLCQYWMSRRGEMGIKTLKHKTLVRSPEKNEENHLQQAVSPPNARCRTDWKVQPASDDNNREFQAQERQRYENPHLPFTYRQHGYESVVGPLRGIYTQSPAAAKARDHNTLIADRPNFVTILALVKDAAARLPNGEGTRWDICELLKSSQYIAPGTSDTVIQSIVSGALDRMHTEPDTCVKYDPRRKLWIYVHRNRSEIDFERLHQQQQRQKKPVFRKTKLLEAPQVIKTVRTYQPKANQPIDVEATLDAQTMVNPKTRISLKNVSQMSPIRIVTSSPKIIPPPMISQSQSPSQSYILSTKQDSTSKNVIKINPTPQQKIILTAGAAKGGKIVTIPKPHSPVTMLSQQKQILTNVIVQQQKAKGGQVGQVQKVPALTPTPQVIQIHQSSGDGKLTTLTPANLTPQQRQTIFQSLKQFKQGQMIVKSPVQVVKSQSNEMSVSAPPLVSVGGKIMKSMVSVTPKSGTEPIMARVVSTAGRQIIDGIIPKTGTTFKISGSPATANSQSNLIQISGSPTTQLTQYVVSKSGGKSIISAKPITSQANMSQNIVTTTSGQNQPIKIIQGGSITAQQLMGAKLINVQTLANKGIKTAGGIKMINPQNYQFANIGGKPLIIANKPNTTAGASTAGGQGIVLQASNAPNGTIILNPQGQQMKVQGNILTQGNVNLLNQQPMSSQPQTVMLGNQLVKVQSLQHKINSQAGSSGINTTQDGQRPIIIGSAIKLMKQNVIKTNVQQQQPQQRVVLAGPGGGQITQQIILPANFQGIKTLQGLKVIPMGQQGSSDRVFTFNKVVSSGTTMATTTINNNITTVKANLSISGPQDNAKE